MVSFCNPGVLGTPPEFRKRFEGPIVRGREPDATPLEAQQGAACSTELSAIVNDFILRRTNALLSAHLPPKVCPLRQVVVCLHSCAGTCTGGQHAPSRHPQTGILPIQGSP